MNKWIMLISIISVALLIVPSIGIAFEGALIEDKIEEEKVEEELKEEVKEEPCVDCTAPEPDEPTAEAAPEKDSSAETPPEEEPTAEEETGPSFNVEQEEIDGYLRLVIDGVEEGEQSYFGDDGEPDIQFDRDAVDEVIVANSNGIVDWPVELEAIPLNILGYAEVSVSSGGEYLDGIPVFAGLDAVDNVVLTVLSAAMMLLIKMAKRLEDNGIGTVLARTISTAVVLGLLIVAADAIILGLPLITFITGGALGTILASYVLSDTLKDIITDLVTTAIISLKNVISAIIDGIDWASVLQNIKDFIQDIPSLIQKMIDYGIKTILAVLEVFEYFKDEPDWDGIKSLLVDLELSYSQAEILKNLLKNSYNAFRTFRDVVFGKRDIFLTLGANRKSLRDLHAIIKPNYQVDEDTGFVAILEIKAISAGNEFDKKLIGVYFEGFDDTPELDLQVESQEFVTNPVGEETLAGATGSYNI